MPSEVSWALIDAAMDKLLPLSQEAREVTLQRIARDNEELGRELRSLLEHMGEGVGFLDRPALHVAPDALISAGSLEPGHVIAVYRIVELLGRGGMGEVYRAERADGQFEHNVALKLMRHEARGYLQRFNVERQILARLEHPGIARLLDGGVATDGRPYMVMELISGLAVTDWCRSRNASLPERLRQFSDICDAVAYAHQNLVVHRDLKPSNVMVTDEGAVKLLDFGVAKLLSEEGDTLARDETRNAPLSLNYASPEQLTSGSVTTASDVYALGALLHELLTGRALWRVTDMPLAIGMHTVLSQIPLSPSQAAAQHAESPIAARLLRGDLDAIVAKALRKEPEQRYATVSALREDVQRSLRRDAVDARRGARLYVFARLLRRYRLAAVAALLLLIAVGVGTGAVAWQAASTAREARRADATRDFLVSVFSASDTKVASDKPRGQITAKELLDASYQRITTEFAGDPQTELQLLKVIGNIYARLGEDSRGDELRVQRIALAQRLYGEASAEVIEPILDGISQLIVRNDYDTALTMLERPDRLLHAARLDESELRAKWWNLEGNALLSRPGARSQRIEAFRKSSELFAKYAPQSDAYPGALSDLAFEYQSGGDLAASSNAFRQAIGVYESSKQRDDNAFATLQINYAYVLLDMSQFDAARDAFDSASRLALQTSGSGTGLFWVAKASVASLVDLRGDRETGDRIFAELLPLIPDDWKHNSEDALVYEYYGNCLTAEGRAGDAIPYLEHAAAVFQARPIDEYDVPRVSRRLGDAYDMVGRTEDARRALKVAYDLRMAQGSADSADVLEARNSWGRFLLAHGRAADAEAEFNEVIQQDHGRKLLPAALARDGLASSAVRAGNGASAIREADQALADLARVTGPYNVRLWSTLRITHARALLLNGDPSAARNEAQQAFDDSVKLDAPQSNRISEAREVIEAASARLAKNAG